MLKPGETVTWIKVDRPRFPISEILASALSIAGIAALFSIALGILIGHFKARRREQGTTGLGLR